MDNVEYTEAEKRAFANGVRKGEKLGLKMAIEAMVASGQETPAQARS